MTANILTLPAWAPHFPGEQELPDDATIYAGQVYVCDGELYRARDTDDRLTVKDLKFKKTLQVISTCNIYERRAALRASVKARAGR